MYSQNFIYSDNDVILEGYVAYNADQKGKRPAVLISHDWTGRNDFVCQKAELLAELGYVGFALDMFGKGVLGATNEEKTKLIEPFMKDRNFLSRRVSKAFEVVKTIPEVDVQRIAAIGFCFGGLCVLDLARSGADLRGVVSFHGLLIPPSQHDNHIKAKVLALHGYDDPMSPLDQVVAFEKEMTTANVDWQMHIYGKTQHAFTNPLANDFILGTVYNPAAEKRSWLAMKDFLSEVFV